jgi:1,4-alpha-glucan branching enzyme
MRQAPSVAAQMASGPSGGAADPHVFVQFRLDAAASRVQLAGSFTNWEPRYEMRQSASGIWTITVPLTQGVHDYAFVVDGQQWVPDPHAPQIGDGFGGTNSRLALLSPDAPRL